ncbi:MAG: acyltransferase [Acidocella sp.]|nr:acyltransferase [Acidocella sp.]
MNAKQEITDLTICRAVFAAWVFTYHVDLYLNFSAWLGPFADLIRHGYLGVDGFFILSGLILARVHPEVAGKAARMLFPPFELPSFKTMLLFWGKRLARIYPVHLATMLILGALVLAGLAHGWAPRDPGRFDVSSFLQNLFLVQGWGGADQGTWNYPSWSVSTEWAGYLLFPICWYLLSYFIPLVAIQVAIVGFVAMGLIFVVHGDNLNLTFSLGLVRFFPEFLIGICTARVVHLYADFQMLRRGSFILGLVLSIASVAFGVDFAAVLGIWLVLFAFLMQADADCPPMLGQRPLLRRFGILSYSFYMSFAVSELLLSQWFRRENWPPASHGILFAGGMLGITVILAIFLHFAVETPCRRIADRWLAARAVSP